MTSQQEAALNRAPTIADVPASRIVQASRDLPEADEKQTRTSVEVFDSKLGRLCITFEPVRGPSSDSPSGWYWHAASASPVPPLRELIEQRVTKAT
jgi:hypothetical protein